MKQVETKKITGKIVVKTGLHIGAGTDEVHIGGVDSPILRNPLNLEPYIPGSSLKGKMRSIMEWKLNKLAADGNPCDCGKTECPICRVFGSANSKTEDTKGRGPTRLIVRDAVLSEKSKELFYDSKEIVEVKAENSINRITAKANPRFLERVVPGVEFDFEISYRVLDIDDKGGIDATGETDKKYFKDVVLESLKILQSDYLGGGGSRGNGQIEFADLKDENGNAITL
jgi:CRISPR-associated protein Csm3